MVTQREKTNRKCPWCECWEPEHTARCWYVQARRPYDPWGCLNKDFHWDI